MVDHRTVNTGVNDIDNLPSLAAAGKGLREQQWSPKVDREIAVQTGLIPEHIANIDDDYEDIKRLALYQKREKLFNKWLKTVKQDIYWKEHE